MNNNQKNRVPGPVGVGDALSQQVTRGPLGCSARTSHLPASSPGATGHNESPVKHFIEDIYEFFGSSFTHVDGIRVDHGTKEQVAELADAHQRGALFISAAIERLEAAKKHPDLLVTKFFRAFGQNEPMGTAAAPL